MPDDLGDLEDELIKSGQIIIAPEYLVDEILSEPEQLPFIGGYRQAPEDKQKLNLLTRFYLWIKFW